jgi:hypothetical protein
MKRRNKSAGKLTIRTKNFIALLKRVHLGGIIEDAVAVVNGKKCYIEAVDLSNNLVVVTSATISKQKSNELELGLGGIDSLIKFFGTIKEPVINTSLSENKLIFIRKDKRRQMKYLLSDPSMIATVLDKDDPEEDTAELFRGMQEYKVVLTREVIQDFHSYVGLSKSKTTEVAYDGSEITITIGSDIEHQFSITIDGEVEDVDGNGENIILKVNGDFLDKVLSTIEIDEENPPQLWIGDSKPVLITDSETIWALLPSAEGETEEEE